jgi:hypothetical protein
VAIALESAWEVLENTDWVIERYRETTMSLDYYGDSVLNSVADIGACAVGYGLAAWFPAWASAVSFGAIEMLTLVMIRDSMLLNVLMLVWPVEAIRNWQMAG